MALDVGHAVTQVHSDAPFELSHPGHEEVARLLALPLLVVQLVPQRFEIVAGSYLNIRVAAIVLRACPRAHLLQVAIGNGELILDVFQRRSDFRVLLQLVGLDDH